MKDHQHYWRSADFLKAECPFCRPFKKTKRYPDGRRYMGLGDDLIAVMDDDIPIWAGISLECGHCRYQEELTMAQLILVEDETERLEREYNQREQEDE